VFVGLAGAALVLLLVVAGVIVYAPNASAPPTRGKAYTANLLGGDLSVVDLERDQVLSHIEVGSNPWGMVASHGGERVYVAVDGGVSVVDSARAERVNFIETNSAYNRAKLAISADDTKIRMAPDVPEFKDLPAAQHGGSDATATENLLDKATAGLATIERVAIRGSCDRVPVPNRRGDTQVLIVPEDDPVVGDHSSVCEEAIDKTVEAAGAVVDLLDHRALERDRGQRWRTPVGNRRHRGDVRSGEGFEARAPGDRLGGAIHEAPDDRRS